jgi:hypothetical protein
MARATSIYVRPELARPIRLVPRDVEILKAVHHHRYLSAEHVHQLFFATSGIRPVTARLRKLWENEYLDRYFVPLALDGTRDCLRQKHPPYYTLTTRGAAIVSDSTGIAVGRIPSTPKQNRVGFTTFAHNLVATDFSVAAEARARALENVTVHVQREHELGPLISTWRRTNKASVPHVQSDGAITVRRADGMPTTFHIEVVRAESRAGNQSIARKLKRYATLNREGFFRDAFGHRHLRAVLLMTTSKERADNLRELAMSLPYGKHLFWFGTYQSPDRRRDFDTVFTPETVFSPMWRSAGDEERHSILPSPRKPTTHVWAPTSTSTITTPTARDAALISSGPHQSRRTTSRSTTFSPNFVVTNENIAPPPVAA